MLSRFESLMLIKLVNKILFFFSLARARLLSWLWLNHTKLMLHYAMCCSEDYFYFVFTFISQILIKVYYYFTNPYKGVLLCVLKNYCYLRILSLLFGITVLTSCIVDLSKLGYMAQ